MSTKTAKVLDGFHLFYEELSPPTKTVRRIRRARAQ